MPIRFRCTQCSQLLGIGRRKAGTAVTCPRCGEALTVPEPTLKNSSDPILESDDFESQLGLFTASEPGEPFVLPSPASSPLRTGTAGPTPARSRSIRVSPTALLWGGALLAAFLLGLTIGVALGVLWSTTPQADPAAGQSVAVDSASGDENVGVDLSTGTGRIFGTIQWINEAGNPVAGQKAWLFALPVGAAPGEKIALAVGDNGPSPTSELTARGIAYARIPADGKFRVDVPSGAYRLLILSTYPRRASAITVGTLDQAILGQYFADVPSLLGGNAHVLITRDIPDGKAIAVDYSFVE